MGSQEPSVRIAPEYIHTDGEDAVKILAAGRLFVDPWQEGFFMIGWGEQRKRFGPHRHVDYPCRGRMERHLIRPVVLHPEW